MQTGIVLILKGIYMQSDTFEFTKVAEYPADQYENVQVLILSCIDPRYIRRVVDFASDRYPQKGVDIKTDAGSAREIAEGTSSGNWILKNIEIARKHHNIQEAVIIMHEDCAYYGGSKSFDSHTEEWGAYATDAHAAAEVVKKAHPELSVSVFIAAKTEESIEFHQVRQK